MRGFVFIDYVEVVAVYKFLQASSRWDIIDADKLNALSLIT
jgi:hypothetical protein